MHRAHAEMFVFLEKERLGLLYNRGMGIIMQVLLTNQKNVTTDITSIIPDVQISGDLLGVSRTLNFSYVYSNIDSNILAVTVETGDLVQVFLNDKQLFYGHVFMIDKGTDSNTIDITCYDYGIYLKKNQHSYKFRNITPEAATKKICSDFKIDIGNIASTGINISRNYFGVDLYSIIIGMYYQASLINGKKYMIRFTGKKLDVIEKGDSNTSQLLQSGYNLLTSNISESIDNMINSVAIFNKDDVFVFPIKNDKDIELYGLMQAYLKIDDSGTYNEKAKSMLKSVERKMSVTSFGNTECITGNTVIVKEPVTKLYGLFYIDSDVHAWKNGIYTNKLVLNFQNIMDEKDIGEIVSSKSEYKSGYKLEYNWRDNITDSATNIPGNTYIIHGNEIISEY